MERFTVFMRNCESAFWKKGMFFDRELRSSVRFFARKRKLGFLLLCHRDVLRTHCCRNKCFPVCPCAQHLLRTHNFVSGTQKMFLILFRNILCPQQMFPSLHSPRNIMGNNVSLFTRSLSLQRIELRWNELFNSWKSRMGILKENNVFQRACSEVLTAVLWESRVRKLCTCQLFIQSILPATQASIYLTWCDDGYYSIWLVKNLFWLVNKTCH